MTDKKNLKMFVLALASAVLLAACQGGANDNSQPVSITLWHYYAGENQIALEQAVSEFNQTAGLEQGIVVESIGMGSIADLEEKVEASAKGVINSDPMPDLFSSYPDVAYKIDELDKLADLNDYFTPEEKGGYIADFLEDGIFSGDRLLLLPVVKSTELLYVNGTAWSRFCREQGYSNEDLATWEALYACARDYYIWTDSRTPEDPWDGTALMGFDSVANYIIAGNRQLGVEAILAQEQGGTAVLDEDVMRRVFDIYYQGYSLGYFGEFGQFRSDDLKQNELIAYIGSSSGASYFPTEVTEGNTQTAIEFLPLPYPAFQGTEPWAIQQGAGMCVAKSDPSRERAAAEFLKWFTSPEQNISFAMTTGYLPVTQEAFASRQFRGALEELGQGEGVQKIVAGVYQVSLEQITQQHTYSAKPFEGSYELRQILQSTLMAAAEEGLEAAEPFKMQGLTEPEILFEIQADTRFDQWLEAVVQELERAEIPYIIVG